MVWGSFFQMIPCKCCCLKNLWMTWCLQRFFQVKVIFKVAKVWSPELLIRRFGGYIVLTCFARISHGKDLLELGKLSFNEQFSVLQVPGRFSEDSMGCSISGVKRRCQWNLLDVWSHTQKKRLTIWSLHTGWNFLQLFWELCEFSSPKVADGASLRIPCPKLLKAFYFATKISLRRFATPFQLCPNLAWHTHVLILAAS